MDVTHIKIGNHWSPVKLDGFRRDIEIELFAGVTTKTKLEIRNALLQNITIRFIINELPRAIIMNLPLGSIFYKVTQIIDDCNDYTAELLGLDNLEGSDGIRYICAPFLGNIIFRAEFNDTNEITLEESKIIWSRRFDLDDYTKFNFISESDYTIHVLSFIGAIFDIYVNMYTVKNFALYYSVVKRLNPQLTHKELMNVLPKLPDKIFDDTSELPLCPRKVLVKKNYLDNPYALKMLKYISEKKPDHPTIIYISDMLAVDIDVLGKRCCVATHRGGIFVNIALARILSGTVKVGDKMFIIYPKYEPRNDIDFQDKCLLIQEVNITRLYMFVGTHLEPTNSVSVGNICGIAGLERHIIQGTATICSYPLATPLIPQDNSETVLWSMIRCNNSYRPQLIKFLNYLQNIDGSLQVKYLEKGELTLFTAGEIHLYHILNKVGNVVDHQHLELFDSMVCFKETIISKKNVIHINEIPSTSLINREVDFNITVIAVPLPNKIIDCIKTYIDLLKSIEEYNPQKAVLELSYDKIYINRKIMKGVKQELHRAFRDPFWQGWWRKIWKIDSDRGNINILFNNTCDYDRSIFRTFNGFDERILYEQFILQGFQMCCRSGPICGQPITNCAFIVNKFQTGKLGHSKDITLSSSNFSVMKNFFLQTLSREQLRIMEPIFKTDIEVSMKEYDVIRGILDSHGCKVIASCNSSEDKIKLVINIPVANSKRFALKIQQATVDKVFAKLKFSHYELVDGDPWYEEEKGGTEQHIEEIHKAKRASILRRNTCNREGLNFGTFI